MRLDLASSLLSAALLLSPAAAVDIHWYKDATTCGGNVISTTNAANNVCYGHPAGSTALSVAFQFVPSGAKAQAYFNSGAGCSSYAGEGGAGYSCISRYNLKWANWFYPYKKLVRKDELEPLGPMRISMTYSLPDKRTRMIEIPSEHVKRAWDLLEAKDYDALAEFPTFVKN